jgi:hypothetical protein
MLAAVKQSGSDGLEPATSGVTGRFTLSRPLTKPPAIRRFSGEVTRLPTLPCVLHASTLIRSEGVEEPERVLVGSRQEPGVVLQRDADVAVAELLRDPLDWDARTQTESRERVLHLLERTPFKVRRVEGGLPDTASESCSG